MVHFWSSFLSSFSPQKRIVSIGVRPPCHPFTLTLTLSRQAGEGILAANRLCVEWPRIPYHFPPEGEGRILCLMGVKRFWAPEWGIPGGLASLARVPFRFAKGSVLDGCLAGVHSGGPKGGVAG